MKIKNTYTEIGELQGWDYSEGSNVDKETIDRWVKETYNNCLKSIHEGFALSSIRSGDSFVQCKISNDIEIDIIIATSRGYKHFLGKIKN